MGCISSTKVSFPLIHELDLTYVDVLNGGRDHVVSIEELWLGLATIRSISVPPGGSTSIKVGTTCLSDRNIGPRDRNKGSAPLFVTKGSNTFEDDLRVLAMLEEGKFGSDRLTVVPLVRPVRSNVVPDGTAKADKMIVEQEVFDLLAEEAPPEPEKVQVVARLARSGAAVGAGAGAANTEVIAESKMREEK